MHDQRQAVRRLEDAEWASPDTLAELYRQHHWIACDCTPDRAPRFAIVRRRSGLHLRRMGQPHAPACPHALDPARHGASLSAPPISSATDIGRRPWHGEWRIAHPGATIDPRGRIVEHLVGGAVLRIHLQARLLRHLVCEAGLHRLTLAELNAPRLAAAGRWEAWDGMRARIAAAALPDQHLDIAGYAHGHRTFRPAHEADYIDGADGTGPYLGLRVQSPAGTTVVLLPILSLALPFPVWDERDRTWLLDYLRAEPARAVETALFHSSRTGSDGGYLVWSHNAEPSVAARVPMRATPAAVGQHALSNPQ